MRKIILMACAVLAFAAVPADARGGGGGSRGGGFSGGSKSSSSGGSKSASSSGGSKGYSAPKTPTASKPSTGSKGQPAPVTKIVPPRFNPPKITAPGKLGGASGVKPRVSIPAGRSYQRDRSFILRNPRYADPYGPSYFGSFNSPFFYMWLGGVLDGDEHNRPLPPESDREVGTAILSYMGIIDAEREAAQ